MSSPALEVRSVSKSFGPLRALREVNAVFHAGEIHAVLGENGAGKSTLMNILAGFLRPDSGTVLADGVRVSDFEPRAMRRQGIALVHQHFMLVPEFSVLENLALDQMDALSGMVPLNEVRRKAEAQAAELGWSFDFAARTGSLPVGIQQRIEILKALATQARVLILDEPTAVLSPAEIEDLFKVMRSLKAQGRALIMIAHKLSEVFAIADRVTVLRRGGVAGMAAIEAVDHAQLGDWMVGGLIPAESGAANVLGEERVSVQRLVVLGDRGETSVNDVSFSIRSGEILGVAGVDGNGQLELAEAVAGIRPFQGICRMEGRLSYIPQDRRRDGLALEMTIWENLVDPRGLQPLISPSREISRADGLRTKFGIKSESVFDRPAELSGGNQQKVVVARELSRVPDVVVAMNPTRGLDVNAAQFVHQQLLEAAKAGAAILLVSTDLDEVMALAHRHLYMSRGKFAESFLGAVP